MKPRAWLLRTWTGRALLSVIVAKALVLIGLIAAGGGIGLETADRVVNLAALVVLVVAVQQLTIAARNRFLWRVRRKLVLSYVLVGAVPILLLLAFSFLGFLLIFFDISSYLVQNRIATMVERASNIANTTLVEIDRTPFEQRADVLERRRAVMLTRYPAIDMKLMPTAGQPRCGLAPSKDLEEPRPGGPLPRWVGCRGFSGLLLSKDGATGKLRLIARAAALPNRSAPDYAVVIDLPIDETSAAEGLRDTGIHLGHLSLVAANSTGALPFTTSAAGDADQPDGGRGLFNTATFFTYTDWQRGLPGRAALSMNVDVVTLYKWLGQDPGRAAGVNFNRILLIMLAGIGALLLVIEMVALLNGVALARSITDSVDELFRGTERVKAGDYSKPIPRRTDDQLGDLALSFNDMTRSIQQAIAERAEKQRLEEELRIARDIQMSLLPQVPPTAPGLSLSALCVPAREVGGDYYDYLPLAGGKFGLLIADVSGKGTSAALYMAELKGLMLSLSRIHESPRALLIEANHIVSQHLDNRSFITMIYAVVDPAARSITCARAGHAPFIRIPAPEDGEGDRRTARVLAPEGMVLGLNLDGGERFERALHEVTLPLNPGDVFFFFTDGISEAMNHEGGFFGELRLTSFLESHAHKPPDDIRDSLLREVGAFAAGQQQHDDITMMILKVDATA